MLKKVSNTEYRIAFRNAATFLFLSAATFSWACPKLAGDYVSIWDHNALEAVITQQDCTSFTYEEIDRKADGTKTSRGETRFEADGQSHKIAGAGSEVSYRTFYKGNALFEEYYTADGKTPSRTYRLELDDKGDLKTTDEDGHVTLSQKKENFLKDLLDRWNK